ncbi:hypothetical protein [Streptomyces sp. NPDC056160]|uniref:hypothetical protein n=1 Tax=Streptomyces sp. NPDC056160 TaxID=3345731 RepID=UPI0035E0472E
MNNEQQSYQLGAREESGRYPVKVGGITAGYIYRRHGSWYSVMPGHRTDGRCADRHAAAQALVHLINQGQRPTVPPQSTRPHTPTALARATASYTYLIPDLRPTLANLVRAAEAMARLAELGWSPLAGYPGADQPWMMQCRLCGWEGRRFWSHLRGRNGDLTPRPITRHPGCLPVADHEEAIQKVTAEQATRCECPFTHPTSVPQALDVLKSIQAARGTRHDARAILFSRAILEPCPASTNRAKALRSALGLISSQK